jgi:hypothetical protein
MENKFEQLIEYIINDEEDKAKELFHDVVVEKSRDIYEELMQDEELEEADGIESEEDLGGDQAEDLIADVEADEEGISEDEDEDEAEDKDYDEDGEQDEHEGDHEELEDRVVDLEDKLDELMAEFETAMSPEGEEVPAEELSAEVPGEEEVGAEDEVGSDSEMELEVPGEEEALEENVDLKPAPKPETKETHAENTVSPVAGKNDMGGTTKNIAQGGVEKGSATPKSEDQSNTTEPDLKKV